MFGFLRSYDFKVNDQVVLTDGRTGLIEARRFRKEEGYHTIYTEEYLVKTDEGNYTSRIDWMRVDSIAFCINYQQRKFYDSLNTEKQRLANRNDKLQEQLTELNNDVIKLRYNLSGDFKDGDKVRYRKGTDKKVYYLVTITTVAKDIPQRFMGRELDFEYFLSDTPDWTKNDGKLKQVYGYEIYAMKE